MPHIGKTNARRHRRTKKELRKNRLTTRQVLTNRGQMTQVSNTDMLVTSHMHDYEIHNRLKTKFIPLLPKKWSPNIECSFPNFMKAPLTLLSSLTQVKVSLNHVNKKTCSH